MIAMAVLLCAMVWGCAPPAQSLPSPTADFSGRVEQRAFSSDSGGPTGMWLFSVRGRASSSALPAPEAYVRVDTTTKFVVASDGRLDWHVVGVPQLAHAFVRVWFRGPPTSVTTSEIWGRAALVVVDSLAR